MPKKATIVSRRPLTGETKNEALVLGRKRSDRVLRRALDGFVAKADKEACVERDPLALVRRYRDPHDQEVAGFFVAMLAYGRAQSIQDKAGALLDLLGTRPARTLGRGQAERLLSGFVYRFQQGRDLPRLAEAVRRLRKKRGSLGAAFLRGARPEEPHYVPAMGRFVKALEGELEGALTYGLRFLLPQVDRGGAAKRLALYLRWMIRPDDGVDLGTWRRLAPGVDAQKLVIPLDTHVERIGRYLGLTDRRSSGMKTALEITAALRRLAPEDPLVYDLVLCHLGISGACPRQKDPVLCRGCPIKQVCRLGSS